MTCEVVRAERITERYLKNGLSAEERAAFEEHYATCTDCFERLRVLEGSLGAAPGRSGYRRKKRRKKHRARKYGWIAGLALVLGAVVGLALLLDQRRPLPSQSESATLPLAPPPPTGAAARKKAPDPTVIAALAAFEPPVYVESKSHGPDNATYKAFQTAMLPYGVRDYGKAADALRPVAEGDKKAAAPRFYLAMCELALKQTDQAMNDLRAAIALGDPQYLEEAHFFLAKGLLATNDLREAREELFRTIRLAGDRLAEARRVLDPLEAQLSGK